jgi:hypothetical protein
MTPSSVPSLVPSSVGTDGIDNTLSENSSMPVDSTVTNQLDSPPVNPEILVAPFSGYHKTSVYLFLGNPPQMDAELDKTADEVPSSEITKIMDGIIKEAGAKFLVTKRISDTREELKVLLQLYFCILRNLARGTRSKSALVPLSSLIDLRNSAAAAQAPDPFIEANNLQTPASAQATPATVSIPDPIIKDILTENIVNVYRNRPYNHIGKLKTPVVAETIRSIQNQSRLSFVGQADINDPNSEKYLSVRNPIKASSIRYRFNF